ncbi:dihydropyrimidinase [Neobacillus pocheonensis]|uniref:dihydropyrimidinase n=1 Tax=Neobacillus pocheonensis TaxID=363869 RepID=UPI003D28D995
MIDLLIKNGTVVNSSYSEKVDVAVKDGKVVALGNADYFPEAKKEIDANGKYVIPGMIDSHVHVNLKLGEFTTTDSFYNASLAAVHGGTTSFIDFAIPYENESPLDAVERRLSEAKGNTLIDYSFHGCVTKGNQKSYEDVRDLIVGGIPSIKMFTVYKDLVMIGRGEIYEVLKIINQYGGIAKFHAENAEMIDYQITKFLQEGKTIPRYHALSRPAISEVEAIASLITLIEHTDAPSIFVHMSTKEAKQILDHAKKRIPLFTEVCSHYLALSEEIYEGENGQNYICSPPIRSKEDRDGLWNMIQEGTVDVVNSDHCCYTLGQKEKYKHDFTKAPNGLPGIETRGTILFSEGVATGKLSINQFVELTSTKVAKLMGMYPNKGIIAVGSDADIVVFDPHAKYQLTIQDLHMQTDYTPFEGFNMTGKPIHTIVRGNHLIDNGNLLDKKVRGEFIKRTKPILD